MEKRNKNYKYNFFHYLKYFWTNFIISWKTMIEFKPNFFSLIIAEFFWSPCFLFFGYIFTNKFGEIIGWSFIDFVIFYYFNNLIWFIYGIFCFHKNLKIKITKGELNKYFYIPGNKFLNFYLHSESNFLTLSLIQSLFYLPFIFYFSNVSFISFFASLFLCLLISFTISVIHSFLNSLSWYFLELGFITSVEINWRINQTLRQIPGTLFTNSKFKYLVMLFPMYFVSTLVVPVLQRKLVPDLLFQITILILLITVFSIGIYINWNYGLKKYEAYG
jgi:hypothetical protein